MALLRTGPARLKSESALTEIEASETVLVLPLTAALAREVTPLIGILRDPSDCVIFATARVHGLRLLTSDDRILNSKMDQAIG